MITECTYYADAISIARSQRVAYVSMVTQLGKWVVSDEMIFNPNQKVIVFEDGTPKEFICGLDGQLVSRANQ
jgi:hypothetical protein